MSRNQWTVVGILGAVLGVVLLGCGCLGGSLLSSLVRGQPGVTLLTDTAAPEDSATVTETPTDTPTSTSRGTPTLTHTPTHTPTNTWTPSPTGTPTSTGTPSRTGTATGTATNTPTATVPTHITCAQAGNHIGEMKCVCCTIVSTYYCSSCGGQPTFLNSHDPYKGYFTALIWGENRAAFIDHFGRPPETIFRGRFSCFYGLIEYYAPNQAPEIVLRNPNNACVDCTTCGR